MPFVKKLSLMFALFATVAHADDAAWDTVQNILMNTQDIVVLDGTEKVPLRYGEGGDAAYGELDGAPYVIRPAGSESIYVKRCRGFYCATAYLRYAALLRSRASL